MFDALVNGSFFYATFNWVTKVITDSQFVSALFGAWFGAYAAFKIGKTKIDRDRIFEEIHNCNRALCLLYSMTQYVLSFKAQHALPIKKEFTAQKNRVSGTAEFMKRGVMAWAPIPFNTDLRILNFKELHAGEMFNLIMGKMSIEGTFYIWISHLNQSVHTLLEHIDYRNRLIEEFREVHHQGTPLNVYFGLSLNADSSVDERYSNVLTAILNSSDDAIYFSRLLAAELERYGKELEAKFLKQFGGDAPRVIEQEFNKASLFGLLPDPIRYRDLKKTIIKRPQRSSLERIKIFLRRERGWLLF